MESDSRIYLVTRDHIHLVLHRDILYCRSDNTQTTFFLINAEPVTITKSIKDVEQELKASYFLRVHQSYLVNMQHLKRVDKKSGFMLILSDDSRVPTSSRKKSELMQILRQT
ncbi:MAG: LytTR family transcriptional regulator DNA-binding domain-containing protein [Bacteroidales bacterium]|nr:LytTR family transcriptional regulator DNA-binding domain-containing protein [Bacteroidales bacterium]